MVLNQAATVLLASNLSLQPVLRVCLLRTGHQGRWLGGWGAGVPLQGWMGCTVLLVSWCAVLSVFHPEPATPSPRRAVYCDRS